MRSLILSYNDSLLKKEHGKSGIGLFNGKLGLCIYFYLQHHVYKDRRFENKANELLVEIISEVDKLKDTSLAAGLTGIGLGIDFLLTAGMCEGNPNIVLKEVDDTLFKALCGSCVTNNNNVYEDICKCLYVSRRLGNSKFSPKERVLFEELLIRSFNKICNNMGAVINSEPTMFSPFGYPLLLFLYLINQMRAIHVYDEKIHRVIHEWYDKLYAMRPVSNGHRYLLNKMLQTVVGIDECQLDELDIDIRRFFTEEMKNKSLSLSSGVSALWLFMQIVGLQDASIEEFVKNKIYESDIWQNIGGDSPLTSDSFAAGLPGIILTYQFLNKSYNSTINLQTK